MKRLALPSVIFLSALCAPAQEPFRLGVDVSLVSMDANVFDRAGNPVTTLTREDFVVSEDGEAQTIREFMSADRPCSTLILFNHAFRVAVLDGLLKTKDIQPISGNPNVEAVWNQLGTFLGQALSRIAGGLRPTDRVSLAAFDLSVLRMTPWRNVRDGIPSNLVLPRVLQPRAVLALGSDVYGAAAWGAAEMATIPDRRVVIMITDGRDTRLDPVLFATESGRYLIDPLFGTPDPREEEVLRKTLEGVAASRARFYFVAYGTDRNPDLVPDYGESRILRTTVQAPGRASEYLERVRLRMERLAEASGGAVFYPKKTPEIGDIALRIGRDATNAYSLSYAPTNPKADGKYRRVEIRVKQPELRVTPSRDGYTAR